MAEYALIIERTRNGFSAYVPDLPGCVAAGDTQEEVLRLIQEAIQLHLEAMREEGRQAPRRKTYTYTIDFAELRVTATPRAKVGSARQSRPKSAASTAQGRGGMTGAAAANEGRYGSRATSGKSVRSSQRGTARRSLKAARRRQ
jgi:predicted RNase H-like HicB family nuclease